MKNDEVSKLVNIRMYLLETYARLRDYKENKNAIMKEADHAKILNDTIVAIDDLLKNHVEFK